MRQGTLTSFSTHSGISQRMVVLRSVDFAKRELLFFADTRSRKMQHFQDHENGAWLFWDPQKKLQIRTKIGVKIHTGDDLAKTYWQNLPVPGRKNYATVLPPGTPVASCTDGLSNIWPNTPTLAETEQFFPNFSVGRCTVQVMQCLHLHREGHQHARFTWDGEQWDNTWLIP